MQREVGCRPAGRERLEQLGEALLGLAPHCDVAVHPPEELRHLAVVRGRVRAAVDHHRLRSLRELGHQLRVGAARPRVVRAEHHERPVVVGEQRPELAVLAGRPQLVVVEERAAPMILRRREDHPQAEGWTHPERPARDHRHLRSAEGREGICSPNDAGDPNLTHPVDRVRGTGHPTGMTQAHEPAPQETLDRCVCDVAEVTTQVRERSRTADGVEDLEVDVGQLDRVAPRDARLDPDVSQEERSWRTGSITASLGCVAPCEAGATACSGRASVISSRTASSRETEEPTGVSVHRPSSRMTTAGREIWLSIVRIPLHVATTTLSHRPRGPAAG
jgi:hypothetical protein